MPLQSEMLEGDKDGKPDQPDQCDTGAFLSKALGALSLGDRGMVQLSGPETQPNTYSCPFQHLSIAFTESAGKSEKTSSDMGSRIF